MKYSNFVNYTYCIAYYDDGINWTWNQDGCLMFMV